MPDSSNQVPPTTARVPNFVMDQSLAKTDPIEAKKMVGLEAKIVALEAQIEDTKANLKDSTAKLKEPRASETVNNHIKLLREYNHVRDIATALMGIIAEDRRVPMKAVYEDFDVNEKD
ncbi:MAG: hypothetical protein Q9183_000149 [Haloplaca sp. 2 TL-2023]